MKKFSGLILLIVILFCSIVLSTTYSKYLISKSIVGEIKVPAVDYCIRNGITKLSECILVMENYSSDVDTAKLYISSKGEADTTNIAPTIKYSENTSELENASGIKDIPSSFVVAPNYTFNSTTGNYTLQNPITIEQMSDEYLGYYTSANFTWTTHTAIYQINGYELIDNGDYNTTRITKAKFSNYKTVNSFDSEIGLYATEDEYGTSYFYRGAVKNNYVLFAGYKWRIIRENGDGSVRLIYNGTESNSNDTGANTTIGNNQYNIKDHDHTYAGYMYDEIFELYEDTNIAWFRNFSENQKYYFSDSCSVDTVNKTFSLNGEMLYGTWKANYETIIDNYPYTCVSTTTDSVCNYIIKAVKYNSDTLIGANFITYGSRSYENTIINTYDSNMKQILDNWYEINFINKKDSNNNAYSNYISDNIFCNDRSVASGKGFSIGYGTYYGLNGVNGRTPTLICPQFADKFTVTDSKGNAKLTYPIALITADEILFAGAKGGVVNVGFWLYNGINNYTMTTSDFTNQRVMIRMHILNHNGNFDAGNVTGYRYIRPVINLKSDIKITQGDGTTENPYVVSL